MHSLDDTYADPVAGLTKSGSDIKESLSAADCHLIHMSMGVSGESGELLDAVNKILIDTSFVFPDNCNPQHGGSTHV